MRQTERVAGYTSVGQASDFRDDIVRVFEVEGVHVAVVRHDGRYYAFEGICPHAGYSFDWTRVRQGDTIVCSSHYSFFELETGMVLNGPATDDLAQYGVRLDGDDVMVSTEPPERRT